MLNKSNAEDFVVENKQIQKAGDNSTQLQIDNATFVCGVTEQRAREIYAEMNEIARRDYTQDAYALAYRRVGKLEELLMAKIDKVDGLLELFADPSFQFLLADAQRKAAATERDNDYHLLSELLGCRAVHNEDRKMRAGISHAVKIVDEIDEDALCALTVAYTVWRMYSLSPSCCGGLDALDEALEKILYLPLPYNDYTWLEHLELLNATNCNRIVSIKNFDDIYCSQHAGCVCVGILKNSDTYQKAIEILENNSLPLDLLVDHEWNNGYVRLAIPHIEYIGHLTFTSSDGKLKRTLISQDIIALHSIWDMYSKDTMLLNEVRKKFVEEMSKRTHLFAVRNWWNSLPYGFNLTHIGIVLAHANAQRLNSDLPDLVQL